MMRIERGWHERLKEELKKPYIQDLKKFLTQEREANRVVYPPEPLIFHAFARTHFENVRVVIVGQDPYHGAGQAHGLCFSVPCGITSPPSLKNIFKELHRDLRVPEPQTGCLNSWANQGVFLLNSILTVRGGEPGSHAGKGWEEFTDAVIELLTQKEKPIVFLLWGRYAKEKCLKIPDLKRHLVLTAAHPSPYSAKEFIGCGHFSKANQFFVEAGEKPIDWSL